jgi:hypothetical protein
MDSVPSAVRAPRQLDAAEMARRKAELAQRDYFTSQATEDAENEEAASVAHVGLWGAIPRAFLVERAAHNLRVDYVNDIHDSLRGLRRLGEWMLFIGMAGIGLMIAAREVEFTYGVGVKSSTVLALRVLNSVTTLALLVVLTMFHSLEHHFESRDKVRIRFQIAR